jgi:hypothetical protein
VKEPTTDSFMTVMTESLLATTLGHQTPEEATQTTSKANNANQAKSSP